MSKSPNVLSGLRSGTPRGRKKASPSGLLISLSPLAADEWTEIIVNIETGLAAIGALVSVIVPSDFPQEILVGAATVIAPDKVKLRFCNNGLHRSRAREFMVRIEPYKKRMSAFPEIQFNLPEIY